MLSHQAPNGYRESLQPPWWLYTFALIGAAALGVAYGSALGLAVGIVVTGVTAAFLVLGLVFSAPQIQVTSHGLRAGSADLPTSAVGEIHILDAAEMRDALNLRTVPASTFTLVRTWAAPRGIRVDISDFSDPHAAWLLSTRHPQRLAGALQQLRDRMDA